MFFALKQTQAIMKNSTIQFKNLYEVSQLSEDQCCELLTQIHWNTHQDCPHCGCYEKFWYIKTVKRYKCSVCKKQFSRIKGTVFEGSHVSMQKWVRAFIMFVNIKKGISSYGLAREIRVTQPTAWFMLHRIRFATFNNPDFKKKLSGIVEIDETYVGGKGKNRRYKKYKRGISTEQKTPVVGIVERGGMVRLAVVKRTKGLSAFAKCLTHDGTVVMSDDNKGYNRVKNKGREHHVINHTARQYVDFDNPEIHTNTIEGFWSHLKRGILGTYHWVSRKYLIRYCHEFQFRYNLREWEPLDSFYLLLSQCINTRLTYATLTACKNR